MSRPYPLVEYARKIGKNTADFAVSDMIKFTKWWVAQEIREDLRKVTPKQQVQYNKDLIAMNKYRAAQQSRLPISVLDQGIESPINNGEEEIVIHADETVCSMELTKTDVHALLWAIGVAMDEYTVKGKMEVSLTQLKEGLEGV